MTLTRTDSKKNVKEYFLRVGNESVGTARDPYFCPLASFYTDVFGWEAVGVVDAIYYGSNKRKPLKKWQINFIELLDRRFGTNNRVTGYEAAEVLENV